MKKHVLHPTEVVIPEMFTNFVEVSIYKHSTNISNDMTKKLILAAAAMLLAGNAAVAAQPKVISHRGYWTAPNSAQNSLASFTKADSIGAFGSEMDVWLTADDKLIVNHDRIYKGTDIDMEKSTLKEITSIVLPNGENIPTLDAYLRLVAGKPDTRLVLEMKSLSDLKREDLAAEKIVKALRKYNLLDRTDIIAFSINACLAFRKQLPDGRIFYLNGDLAPKSIKKLGLTGIDYSMKVLRKHPEWVKQAQELGLEVNVWTVDTEEDMRYFIEQGVDYITTDYPERLQALLKK
jgi:glycerophosphoryl diester phosphodiesterase